jgi:hypothetical protein
VDMTASTPDKFRPNSRRLEVYDWCTTLAKSTFQ